MAEFSAIEWTDSTWNPWIGCTHYGPGCHNCYADALAGSRLGVTFGKGETRRRTKDWHAPVRLNRKAEKAGRPAWLFIASLADVFDDEVPPEWRAEMWDVIRPLKWLRIQIVTKRIANAAAMLPPDWLENFQHVGLISTIVTQKEADRDIPILLSTPARWRGLSMEPLLEAVTIWTPNILHRAALLGRCDIDDVPGLDWVIVGGESGPKARQFALPWAAEIVTACFQSGVPVFVKQIGDNPRVPSSVGGLMPFRASKKGKLMEEWPEALRVRQMPQVYGPDLLTLGGGARA